ncbi:MAG: hypothetical protein IKZ07_05565 [Akkermansia sp.]|nr:hypothetical protein [Akkermansia sp.]
MGFFSKVKKIVKQMHSPQAITSSIAGGAMGFVMGGPAGAIAGAIGGGLQGTMQARQEEKQEKAQDAQLAAAQRLADAQNPANVVRAVTPTAGMENAQISEESMAADAKRRYSFGKALYKRNLLGRTQGGNITKQILG